MKTKKMTEKCGNCGHKKECHSKICYYINEYHEQCTCKEFKQPKGRKPNHSPHSSNSSGTSTLSSKEVTKEGWKVYPRKDVREFIKELKVKFKLVELHGWAGMMQGKPWKYEAETIHEIIDKLAGKELT